MGERFEVARARAFLGSVNLAIISAAGARRSAVGRGEGARPPAGLAGARVSLVVLDEVSGGAGSVGTPAGYKTARRDLPALLAGLPEHDPRRIVAARVEGAAAVVAGSGRGVDLAAGSGGGVLSGKKSDGGAVRGVVAARRLAALAAAAGSGGDVWGGPRVVLPVRRARGSAKKITAWGAVLMLCVDGLGVSEILARHGWSRTGRNVRELSEGLLVVLDDMAAAEGLGRGGPRAPLDAKTRRE